MESFLFPFIIVVLLGCIILFYAKFRKGKFTQNDRFFFRTQWHKIIEEKNSTVALFEADKLLDLALKKIGYTGSLGEKLKKAERLFSDINGIWFAHKLRNRLAHEMNVRVSNGDIEKALKLLKKGLQDLKALS